MSPKGEAPDPPSAEEAGKSETILGPAGENKEERGEALLVAPCSRVCSASAAATVRDLLVASFEEEDEEDGVPMPAWTHSVCNSMTAAAA